MSDQKPIYDSKVKKILKMMKTKTRDEAAEELKYKNWKSLDMYMRRKNFTYDADEKKYVPLESVKKAEITWNPKDGAPTKVVGIITAFENEDVNPKATAIKMGFKDHKEMAEYMKTKGYEWNAYRNNYIKIVGKKEAEEEGFPDDPVNVNTDKNVDVIEDYLPFIRLLYERRDEIYQILSGPKEDGRIPRYALPGMVRTKGIYMSELVSRLVGEYSREKNITQREIMEGALIEYMQKYGFRREVESLLKNQQ